jgi:serine/threonine protein kinase
VFSLGVVLYELLCGERPFPKKAKDEPYPQTFMAPLPLRGRRPAVPKGLEEQVMSCLERRPDLRPSLAALLPGLHRFIRSGRPMWPAGFHPGIEAD